jgi:predicted nucleotidyltransferase
MMTQLKNHEILELFLGDYNKEIHGRGIIGKVKLSQKNIALTLDSLEKEGILKSRIQGNMKFFRLNVQNTEIKDILNLVEVNKKIKFLAFNRKITSIFRADHRIVGVFGSYAKGAQKKGSDLDLFIVGYNKTDHYSKLGKELDIDISIKFFTEKDFIKLLKQRNPLVNEIVNNHVLLFGSEKFIDLLWRNYYGFP